MKPAESNLDRRAFGRRPTTINANVRLGYRILTCLIKDISEGGALLEFAEDVDLPSRLWLSWADSAEIMCEVRHQRNRRVGVQFLRPQALALRPAVAPVLEPAAQPAPRAQALTPATRASDIVARCRNARRAPAADLAGASEIIAKPVEQACETPRDVSTILISLRAAAQSLALERAARRVPAPLAAALWPAVAPSPPALALVAEAPLPLPARAYAGQTIAPAEGAAQVSLETSCPAPLPAAALAGAVVVPPAAVLAAGLPLPLPAGAYAQEETAADHSVCGAHPCAMAFWRSITSPPPRPLAARRYAVQVA